MVGYILGLGDRHPSNLMLDRISGSIMHVDFGDCFEVAMKRPKYPEKVPFRLTRMLIKAMEVCGIEGTYRKTCEKVMHVMRLNADSLIAVLEASENKRSFFWLFFLPILHPFCVLTAGMFALDRLFLPFSNSLQRLSISLPSLFVNLFLTVSVT